MKGKSVLEVFVDALAITKQSQDVVDQTQFNDKMPKYIIKVFYYSVTIQKL